MSLIESAPQKQKTFNPKSQDHGDASQRKGINRDIWSTELERHAKDRNEQRQFKKAVAEATIDYESMTPAQLEAAASKLLAETADAYEEWPILDSFAELDQPDDEPNEIPPFITEAELGLRDKHEIKNEMAKRVMLDHEHDQDDRGDSDFNSPIRIKNRL